MASSRSKCVWVDASSSAVESDSRVSNSLICWSIWRSSLESCKWSSRVSSSARLAQVRTVLLRRSRSSNVCSKPKWLLTIAPQLAENNFKVRHARGGRFYHGLEVKHVAFVKLPGFGVHPALPSLLPTVEQFLGQRGQPRPTRARAHAEPPSEAWGPAAEFFGASVFGSSIRGGGVNGETGASSAYAARVAAAPSRKATPLRMSWASDWRSCATTFARDSTCESNCRIHCFTRARRSSASRRASLALLTVICLALIASVIPDRRAVNNSCSA